MSSPTDRRLRGPPSNESRSTSQEHPSRYHEPSGSYEGLDSGPYYEAWDSGSYGTQASLPSERVDYGSYEAWPRNLEALTSEEAAKLEALNSGEAAITHSGSLPVSFEVVDAYRPPKDLTHYGDSPIADQEVIGDGFQKFSALRGSAAIESSDEESHKYVRRSSAGRSGCPTCQRRRIRCDLATPACSNCTRSKRKCEGYSDLAASGALVEKATGNELIDDQVDSLESLDREDNSTQQTPAETPPSNLRTAVPEQIAPLAARCLLGLRDLAEELSDSSEEASAVASHLARLKIWVGSMGAHRVSGSRSLEYRLRDASSIRNHVITLLRDLNKCIEEGTKAARGEGLNREDDHVLSSEEEDDDDSKLIFGDDTGENAELHRILDDIGDVISCLLRLSTALSNPAPHDHFRSRAGAEILEHYEWWDIQHVQEKFGDLESGLSERLGRAIAYRRQYFRYREEHHHRLAEGVDDIERDGTLLGVAETIPGERTTIASSLPEHLKDSASPAAAQAEVIEGFGESRTEASRTSYAPSSVDSGELQVPPIPEGYANGPILCPFCFTFVSVDGRPEWKKHVFRDLRPYVCLADSCTIPDRQYMRRSEWMKHMKLEHWKTWHCPFGCPVGALNTPDAFRDHIQSHHVGEVAADNLDVLEALSCHMDPAKAQGRCILCQDFQISSDQIYETHIGNHLEQLALFALPKTEAEEEGDEGASDDVSVDSAGRSLEEISQNRPDEELLCSICHKPFGLEDNATPYYKCQHPICDNCLGVSLEYQDEWLPDKCDLCGADVQEGVNPHEQQPTLTAGDLLRQREHLRQIGQQKQQKQTNSQHTQDGQGISTEKAPSVRVKVLKTVRHAERDDVNIPADSKGLLTLRPKDDFELTWTVQNTGDTQWPAGIRLGNLEHTYGNARVETVDGIYPTVIEPLQPGEECRITIQRRAPPQSGTHTFEWSPSLKDGTLIWAGCFVCVVRVEPKFQCHCGSKFSSSKELKKHQKGHRAARRRKKWEADGDLAERQY